MVYIPDDSDFSSFREQCESLEGWHCRYNKAGVTVWSQGQEESCAVQKIKVSRRFPAPAGGSRGSLGTGPCWKCPARPSWGCFCSEFQAWQGSSPEGASRPGSRSLRRARSGGAAPIPTRPGRPWDQLRSGDGLAGSPRAHGMCPWCPCPGSATLGTSHGMGPPESPRCCFGRFVACQGLDLGFCRGTRRSKHPSGTLWFIHTALVALPGDPGHTRSGCRVLR